MKSLSKPMHNTEKNFYNIACKKNCISVQTAFFHKKNELYNSFFSGGYHVFTVDEKYVWQTKIFRYYFYKDFSCALFSLSCYSPLYALLFLQEQFLQFPQPVFSRSFMRSNFEPLGPRDLPFSPLKNKEAAGTLS